MMARRTKSINIRCRRGFAAILFRRRIALGSDHRPFLSDLKRFGNAKIYQDYIAITIDHNVRGLHIAKNNGVRFVTMQESQYIAKLDRPCQDLFLRQKARCVADDRLQVFAVDKFLNQIRTVFLGKIIVDARNGWMIERCQNVRFALEIMNDGLPRKRIGRDVRSFL